MLTYDFWLQEITSSSKIDADSVAMRIKLFLRALKVIRKVYDLQKSSLFCFFLKKKIVFGVRSANPSYASKFLLKLLEIKDYSTWARQSASNKKSRLNSVAARFKLFSYAFKVIRKVFHFQIPPLFFFSKKKSDHFRFHAAK